MPTSNPPSNSAAFPLSRLVLMHSEGFVCCRADGTSSAGHVLSYYAAPQSDPERFGFDYALLSSGEAVETVGSRAHVRFHTKSWTCERYGNVIILKRLASDDSALVDPTLHPPADAVQYVIVLRAFPHVR